MPQIKSAKKRVRTQEASRIQNASQLNSMRSIVKDFEKAAAKNESSAKDLYKKATRAIDMAKSKGLIKQNKAARDKSRLASKLNK